MLWLKRFYLISLGLMLLFSTGIGIAAEPTTILQASSTITSPITVGHELKVGVILGMPFAQNFNGHYSGIAIEIWEKIAAKNHWTYNYISLGDNIDQGLEQLSQQQSLDLIIGPLAVNSARLARFDFTRPFFLSSVGVITKKQDINILKVFQQFFSGTVITAILILAGSFFLYLLLLWRIERGKLNDVFTHYYTALTKGIALHILRKGFNVPKGFYLRIALSPTAIYSRIVSLLWLLLAGGILLTINANYIAIMTLLINNNNNKMANLKELQTARVVGIRGQSSIEVAEKNGIHIQKITSFNAAVDLLNHAKIDAIISDTPLAMDYLQGHGSQHLFINSLNLQNDELAFALPLGSPLKHPLDLAITRLQDQDSVIAICKKYIGRNAMRCDL